MALIVWRKFICCLSILILFSGCAHNLQSANSPRTDQRSAELQFDSQAVNSPSTMLKPYVILISIDGYRHDYNQLFSPPNLSALANEGVLADSLRPVFPSKTFVNHMSLITGSYPDRHGFVANEFYDPGLEAGFSIKDSAARNDGRWCYAEPLWVTAGKQGMLTASQFWFGSEMNISGRFPNYYQAFDQSMPNEKRVLQVLEWLRLPEPKRPHFLTLYFDSVDSAAHHFGVRSAQTQSAVLDVDRAIGLLRDGIKALNLPINLIIVSDHGMLDLEKDKLVVLDSTVETARILAKFRKAGQGPQMLLYLHPNEPKSVIVEAQKLLSGLNKNIRVYRRSQLVDLHYHSTLRTGDLVVDADAPYFVGLRSSLPSLQGANHGWNPIKNKSMHGVFFATGPAFKAKLKVSSFENIHVYPLVLEILKLRQLVPIDGQAETLQGILQPGK